jgi:hypothetical protein
MMNQHREEQTIRPDVWIKQSSVKLLRPDVEMIGTDVEIIGSLVEMIPTPVETSESPVRANALFSRIVCEVQGKTSCSPVYLGEGQEHGASGSRAIARPLIRRRFVMTTRVPSILPLTLAEYQALVTGIPKNAPNATFGVAGQTLSATQAVTFINTVLTAVAATATAKTSWKDAKMAEQVLVAQDGATIRGIRASLATMFSNNTTALADLMITPRKPYKPLSAAARAAANAKAAATRAARGTKGSVQKAAITGNVTGVTITPVVAGASAAPSVPTATDAASTAPNTPAPTAPSAPVIPAAAPAVVSATASVAPAAPAAGAVAAPAVSVAPHS